MTVQNKIGNTFVIDDDDIDALIKGVESAVQSEISDKTCRGVAARFALAIASPSIRALCAEFEMNTDAKDILNGMIPMIANLVCTVCVNLSDRDIGNQLAYIFIYSLIKEIEARLLLVDGDSDNEQIVAKLRKWRAGLA